MLHNTRAAVSVSIMIALTAIPCLGAWAGGAREKRAVGGVGGFDGVSFSSGGELIITQGDREALEIEALDRDFIRIVTEVRGGTLYISETGSGWFSPFRPPVFRLTVKTIKNMEAHGSGRISAANLRTDSLRVLITSSGSVSLESLDAESLEARLSSSGSLTASGRVTRQNVLLSSSGNYGGGALESAAALARASSSGSAVLRFSGSLEATVTSSGDVRYYGNPAGVNAKVTSSGRLIRLGH